MWKIEKNLVLQIDRRREPVEKKVMSDAARSILFHEFLAVTPFFELPDLLTSECGDKL